MEASERMNINEHYTVLAPKLLNWLVATGSSYAQACDFDGVCKHADDLFIFLFQKFSNARIGAAAPFPAR